MANDLTLACGRAFLRKQNGMERPVELRQLGQPFAADDIDLFHRMGTDPFAEVLRNFRSLLPILRSCVFRIMADIGIEGTYPKSRELENPSTFFLDIRRRTCNHGAHRGPTCIV